MNKRLNEITATYINQLALCVFCVLVHHSPKCNLISRKVKGKQSRFRKPCVDNVAYISVGPEVEPCGL
jgi:hypothetical protein